MRIILFLLLQLLLVKSYTQERAKIAFLYNYKHKIDTTLKDYFYTEKMILLQGDNTSIFKSYDAYTNDSTIKAQIRQSEGSINMSGLKISTKPVIRDMVLKNFVENKLLQIRYLLQYYYWNEPLHNMNWQISQDTISLNSLKCQRATCAFKGRNYSAWFSTEITSNNGPWKFGGLPGLIVNVTDSKNEISFDFAGYVSLTENFVSLPPKSVESTNEQYLKVRDAYLNDPMSFLQNSGSIGGNVKMTGLTSPLKGKKPINNPIELSNE